jgi:hypothetical protein
MNDTMIKLFAAAGYPDPEKVMKPMERYDISDKKITIKAFDTETKQEVWKPVKALFYKGMSEKESSYRVINSSVGAKVHNESFLCTGDHLLYAPYISGFSPKLKGYVPVKSLYEISPSKAFTITSENQVKVVYTEIESTRVTITKVSETFPILDIEVEDTANYISAGIVSHNSFGGGAKLFSEGLRKFNPILGKFGASMIVISQERANQSMFGADFKPTGGYAIKFYASNRSRVTRIDTIKEKGVEVGIIIKVKNGKNKCGIPYREAQLTLYFDRGFDVNNEYIDFVVSLGIIQQAGAYFKSEEYNFSICGREKLQAWLNEHPKEYEEIKLKVNEGLCGTTHLDVNNKVDPEDDPDEPFEEPPEIIPEE